MDQLPLDQLNLDRFSAQMQTAFSVPLEGAQPLNLTLKEASVVPGPTPEKPDSSGKRYEAFSLVFEGPGETFLPQRTYRLEHAAMGGWFELFLVPIGNERGAYQYQALLNRRIA